MTKFLSLFFLLFYFGNSSHSAVFFEPATLGSTKSTWHKTNGDYKGEYYFDYLADGRVVFRVLERFKPAIDSLITEAKSKHGALRLADPTIIYFESSAQIKDNFSVSHQNEPLAIDPANLELSFATRGCLKKKTYYVTFSSEGSDIRISKGVFKTLQIARESALAKGAWLEVDMKLLQKDDVKGGALATIVAAQCPSEDLSCVICLDKRKNTMIKPCNHICLCEACDADDKLTHCPLCQGAIAQKERVYY